MVEQRWMRAALLMCVAVTMLGPRLELLRFSLMEVDAACQASEL
jgi:hypothetical protein